jgi:hypothetical protein
LISADATIKEAVRLALKLQLRCLPLVHGHTQDGLVTDKNVYAIGSICPDEVVHTKQASAGPRSALSIPMGGGQPQPVLISDSALPMDSQRDAFLLVMNVQVAVMSAVHCFAYTAWQMDISGRNDNFVGVFLDGHDAMEGMFGFLGGLFVVRQIDDICFMCLQIHTAQGEIASGILIADSETGRAHLLMGRSRAGSPCPSTLMVHRLAVRANRWFRQLPFGHIGVMFTFLNEPILPILVRSGYWPLAIH